MRLLPFKLILACAAALLLAAPVLSGGWVVVTLDELPARIVANEPVKIGFMVRGHGVMPTNGTQPVAIFLNEDDRTRHRFEGKQEGTVGHYVAEIKLPKAGRWRWHIQTFMEHTMPDLTVEAPVSAPALAEPRGAIASESVPASFVVGVIGLAGLVVAAFAWFYKRPRFSAATAAIALIIAALGLASTATGGANVFAAAREGAEAQQRAESARQASLGQDLFLAKGCATCHTHAAVADKVPFTVNAGPELTHRPLDPNYLRVWLKDPKAVRPATDMPNLELKKTEIEALTAFLTQK